MTMSRKFLTLLLVQELHRVLVNSGVVLRDDLDLGVIQETPKPGGAIVTEYHTIWVMLFDMLKPAHFVDFYVYQAGLPVEARIPFATCTDHESCVLAIQTAFAAAGIRSPNVVWADVYRFID